MPIEIRELIIKTQISSLNARAEHAITTREIELLKREVMQECKRMMAINLKKNINKR